MKSVLAIVLIMVSTAVFAEEYMLPKSFSVKKPELKSIEDKIKPKVEKKQEPFLTDVSLADLVKNFEYDYESTFKHTLNTFSQLNITILKFDTERGHINARMDSGKELFIFILPSSEKLTHVRITPADGRYDISVQFIKNIFRTIERSLYSGNAQRPEASFLN